MSRLMRCSRVGGVILYSFDNGHFMAYTSPPPPAEPLLKEKPFGECTFQLSPIAVQRLHSYSTTPPWHADRRSAQGVRSTTEGEIFKGTDGACADPDTRIFPATGVGRQCRLPALFKQLSRPQYRFFVTFLVRPALLPYGKRGFRAAIYKIARPQPPAAAL